MPILIQENRVMNSLKIRNAIPVDAQAIFELSCTVYGDNPRLPTSDYIPTAALMRHIERFGQGIFVAEIDKRIVGYAITMRTNHSPKDEALNWFDAIGGLEMTKHEPNGAWLYGVDFGVHPDFRKSGVGTQLYRARFELVERLDLDGFYAGGMLAGYVHFSQRLSIEEYGEHVRKGRIIDPTVSMQMKRGFQPGNVIQNYCGDSVVDCSAMMIVWHNQ
jgi:GNAT superfamily N-acetyltransferase